MLITPCNNLKGVCLLAVCHCRLAHWRSWKRSPRIPKSVVPSLTLVAFRPWSRSSNPSTRIWSAWQQKPLPMWPSLEELAGRSDNMEVSESWYVEVDYSWMNFIIGHGIMLLGGHYSLQSDDIKSSGKSFKDELILNWLFNGLFGLAQYKQYENLLKSYIY